MYPETLKAVVLVNCFQFWALVPSVFPDLGCFWGLWIHLCSEENLYCSDAQWISMGQKGSAPFFLVDFKWEPFPTNKPPKKNGEKAGQAAGQAAGQERVTTKQAAPGSQLPVP